MRYIGSIIRLQIQRATLKVGQKPNRVYDPTPLLPVEALTLTSEGAMARAPEGDWVLDIHHTRHPDSHNDSGQNALSIGFTRHYDEMQAHFGADRVPLGCAGENIIIETATHFTLPEVANGLWVERADGSRLALSQVLVAAPCKAFANYVLGGRMVEPETLNATLKFLHDGMRGYYVAYVDATPQAIHLGDKVYAAE